MNTIARNYLTSLINHATFCLINCGKEDNAGLQGIRTTESGGERETEAGGCEPKFGVHVWGVCVFVWHVFDSLSEIYRCFHAMTTTKDTSNSVNMKAINQQNYIFSRASIQSVYICTYRMSVKRSKYI